MVVRATAVPVRVCEVAAVTVDVAEGPRLDERVLVGLFMIGGGGRRAQENSSPTVP